MSKVNRLRKMGKLVNEFVIIPAGLLVIFLAL